MLKWISLTTSKYYNWKQRENQHNSFLPKAHWLLPWEIDAIVNYRLNHFEEGYRLLCFMMLDENVVAVSPSSVYRVLLKAGLLLKNGDTRKPKAVASINRQNLINTGIWILLI